jgi:tetratricopeptide (TPR) repeat protein
VETPELDGQKKEAVRMVARALVDAITQAQSSAVFLRCASTEAQEDAMRWLTRFGQRVRWVEVDLHTQDDPLAAFTAAAQGNRTLFAVHRISDAAMQRLQRELERFEALQIRVVFILLPGQVTLFARGSRRFWDKRALYLAWPSEETQAELAQKPHAADGLAPSFAIRRRLEAAQSMQDRRARGNAVFVACRDAFLAGDLATAGEFLMQAVKDLREEGSSDELAMALQLLGSIAERRNDLRGAMDWYLEAKNYWEATENPTGLGAIYTRIGSLHFLSDQLQEADRHLTRALEYEETLGSPGRLCDAHRFVGMVRERQRRLSEAEQSFNKSLRFAEELGDEARKARVLHQRGHLFEKQEKWTEAKDTYLLALRTREALGDLRGVAATLHQLGNVHYHRAEYPQCVESYQRAIEIETRVGDDQGLASTLLQLAHVSEERFQHALAYTALARARPLLRRLQSPLVASIEERFARIRDLLSPEEVKRLDAKLSGLPQSPPPSGGPPPPRDVSPVRRPKADAPAAPPRAGGSSKPAPEFVATDEDLKGFKSLLDD